MKDERLERSLSDMDELDWVMDRIVIEEAMKELSEEL